MRDINITIKPDRLNAPLATAYVGKLSSAVFVFKGDIPDDVSGLVVQIERTPENGNDRPNLTAATVLQGDGTYRAYLSPFYFQDNVQGLHYHLIAVDASGNPRWLGKGDLVILDNPANGTAVTPEIIPQDTYIYNPTTGLYHKLTAEVDEYGEISIEVAQEGVTR